ncbi:MAG: hypothetical protein NXI23_13645 [Bacteroidetes bacterium]|nr:hypothetical protein [Bacteroidota bacterium]MDF1868449.1 hypothetical protein [Saprospiraceae bacterium]
MKVGWNYTVVEKTKEDWVYDTTLLGYSNQDHYFRDKFLKTERMTLIEYLKTL